MNDLPGLIRRQRRAFGLSQVELSHLSGISLPTIQNVEAGRANPSLSILESLLAPLGLMIDIQSRKADWDALAALGLPLSAVKPKKVRPGAELLLANLRLAALELAGGAGRDGESERKREALGALLLALKLQFPRFFKKHIAPSPSIARMLPRSIDGRMIKLKRLAERRLSEYL
jgi:transcriptional regulator with XRE-family HTH domain